MILGLLFVIAWCYLHICHLDNEDDDFIIFFKNTRFLAIMVFIGVPLLVFVILVKLTFYFTGHI